MSIESEKLKAEIADLYDRYGTTLDDVQLDDWPGFFTIDAEYRITTRENWDGGFPLSTMLCEGVAMMKDRAAAIQNSMMYAPRVCRRFQSGIRVLRHQGDELETRSNFLVVQTMPDKQSEVAFCGVSFDCIFAGSDRLYFSQRLCILDTEMIPNSLVYPI